MLRITVEIVPFGQESLSRIIGTGTIINDGTGNSVEGNYDCKFREIDYPLDIDSKVEGFDRSRGFWSLIGEALMRVTKNTR